MASVSKRPNGYWRALWKNPEGREVTKSFKRKVDAERHVKEMTAALVTDTYIDPGAGKVTFQDYAEQWRALRSSTPGHPGPRRDDAPSPRVPVLRRAADRSRSCRARSRRG